MQIPYIYMSFCNFFVFQIRAQKTHEFTMFWSTFWQKSKKHPKHFQTSSQTFPKIIPNMSENHPKHYQKTSQTYPKNIPNVSKYHAKHVQKSSKTSPKIIPNLLKIAFQISTSISLRFVYQILSILRRFRRSKSMKNLSKMDL